MSQYTVQSQSLTSVANAIRTKTGSNVTLEFPNGFVTAIGSISGGGSSGTYQVKTGITPTESSQTITPDSGYDALSSVQINAISSSYVGSGVTTRSSSDLSSSGATVNVPVGYYAEVASKSVASGTEGTPVATKGTVSNHTISVTPSVTNTAGYISGGTRAGTAVSVTASELASGNKAITSNGTGIDVVGYSTVSVDVDDISVSDVSNATGTTAAITGTISNPSATSHSIYLEFSDNTNATIPVYYNDSLIGTMITAYTPTTYNSKTVTLAQLDNVTWYARSTGTYETVFNGITSVNQDANGDYPYLWISDLSSVTIADGSVWRITYENVEYVCTAVYNSDANGGIIGNLKWVGRQDDGTSIPFCFMWSQYGAWTGGINLPNQNSTVSLKIERQVSS